MIQEVLLKLGITLLTILLASGITFLVAKLIPEPGNHSGALGEVAFNLIILIFVWLACFIGLTVITTIFF